MEQRVKILVAAGILLGGALLALLFHHKSPEAGLPPPGYGDHLVLRKQAAPDSAATPDLGTSAGETPATATVGPSGERGPPPKVLMPLGGSASPPDMARSYPAAGAQGTSRWGVSMGMMLPDARRPSPTPRVHKVVDGDTLAALAERYLGSAARAGEVFAANKDVLVAPQILPIGVELKIPPSDAPPQFSP
jgi:nucleoid-associated protein YgaU